MSERVPDKPTLEGLEGKWAARWEADGVYRFEPVHERSEVYSIDTPPPYVSGDLHVGNVFSYTHTDLIARYKRMRGLAVFYPMGWDDNGLPTERRVQAAFGVRCEPSLPYDPGFTPPAKPGRELVAVSRRNFVELCTELTAREEQSFEQLFRRLGLSVDWRHTYTTIGPRAQRVSQVALIRLIERGLAYQQEAPTLWDVDFQTALAQAELEDRELDGSWYRIAFGGPDGSPIEIDTTRPELLPACVALVAHPDDARYKRLTGSQATTPVFEQPVPILAHALADPDKGTGIAMVCTWGDLTDVQWWRELRLPVRSIVRRDGTIAHDRLNGLTVEQARATVVQMLREEGALKDEPRRVTHAVKFYERGVRPLEIVSSRQWFIKTLDFADELLERGAELSWHPEHMRSRYESWVRGLNSDWCISRQRFFGVPIPVWYRVSADTSIDYQHPILPGADRLPIDPSSDVPDGYRAEQRGEPGGFIGDPDVMDTWATSSVSPQIVSGWPDDERMLAQVFPMDLRPQAHDIIRTWLFYAVLRSHLEHRVLPWANAAISGYVNVAGGGGMSKSMGTGIGGAAAIERLGADAVRHWAARGRLGYDTVWDDDQIKVGRRLALKILNASKFVLGLEASPGEVSEALDRSMLARLARFTEEATSAFESYDHARALERAERFFWDFCDDHLELVKARAYAGSGSAAGSMRIALSTMLRLLAPFVPFVTEECWSWFEDGSVHTASWPDAEELLAVSAGQGADLAELAASTLVRIRRVKAAAKISPRAEVSRVTVRGDEKLLATLEAALDDVKAAGHVVRLATEPADDFDVQVEL
jgi:valyl-tRNA synthetase